MIGGLILLGIIGQAFGGNNNTQVAAPIASTTVTPTAAATPAEPSTPATAASTEPADPDPGPAEPDPTEEPDNEYGSQPRNQTEFVAAVAKAQDSADEADNDMKLGAALSRRNKALCKIVDNGRVKNWSGKITSLDANGEGKGVVSIEIGTDVQVSTWNNAFSDYEDHTLIPPGDLFDEFLSHAEGDAVTFSGKLMDGDACVNDSRLTLRGKLTDPDFMFKFSGVK